MVESIQAPSEKIETRAEAEKDAQPEDAKFWLGEIAASSKRLKGWHARANKVVARYRDERPDDDFRGEKRANILWSNTEILKSALFQRLGAPDVRRRFPKKGKDEKATRQAALVLERGVSYGNDAYDCTSVIESVIEDACLPGWGVAWVVYDSIVDGDEIKSQTVKDTYVYWQDFRTSAGRTWQDIWWVARGDHYKTRDELNELWPKHAAKIPLNAELVDPDRSEKSKDDDTFKRARIWEIWDKVKRQRVYVAEGYNYILQTDDDPYRLQAFFPCPEPLRRVSTTNTFIPIPEFALYQDQANELDVINTRLYKLTEAMKRRGVYAAGIDGQDTSLGQLAYAGDNDFLPFKNFDALMEKGGLKNVFQTEDLKPIAEAITVLYQRATALIQTIYDVTGISDVMRGANAQNQTATEVRIKGQFGSMRLQKSQDRVQRFVRDLTRIKAEIIAEHFTRETLQEMTGLMMPTEMEKKQAQQQLAMVAQQQQAAQAQAQAQQQGQSPMMGHNGGPPMPQIDPQMVEDMQETVSLPSWEEISNILRSDERRGYKVDVETDQTAQVDEDAEKAARTEFLSTMMVMLEKLMPVMGSNPAMIPLMRETVMFTVKAFKAGRPLEQAFEDTFERIEKNPPQPQPDPNMLKLQMEQKSQEADLQFKAKQSEQDAALKDKEFAHEAKLKEMEFAHNAQLEQQKLSAQMDLEQQKLGLEHERLGHQMEFEWAKHQNQHALAESKQEAANDQAERKLEAQAEQATASAEAKAAEPKARGAVRKLAGPRPAGPMASVSEAMKASSEASTSMVTQMMQQMMSMLTEDRDHNRALMQNLFKAVTAPKQVVRDPVTGKAVGVQTVAMN